jgi:dTDP-4-dehydrorhamnose 3,5-epimerase
VKATPTAIADVLVLEPVVHGDARGFFFESFNQQRFEAAVGRHVTFVQDNHAMSAKGVLRGLHYQLGHAQDKLLRVVRGEVFDVAVDMRRSSPTFGQWVGVILSAENKKQLWVPKGFAHGYLTLSEPTELLYKVTDYYAPAEERCLMWNDATVGIVWPAGITPQLSDKDRRGVPFAQAETFA